MSHSLRSWDFREAFPRLGVRDRDTDSSVVPVQLL